MTDVITAIDTETTGLDPRHGARPHFVSTFDGRAHTFWQWDADPLTRAVLMPAGDAAEVRRLVLSADQLVGHNVKFDATALKVAGAVPDWPWDRTEDTLLAGHLLESALPHDLTAMAVRWLGVNVKPFEDRLKGATGHARRRVQQARAARERGNLKPPDEDALADWAVAEEDRPDMPSAGKEPWKADAWMVRLMARHDRLPEPAPDCAHRWVPVKGLKWVRGTGRTPWKRAEEDGPFEACARCRGRREWVLCREYALSDVETTWHLWWEASRELNRRGQTAMYRERAKAIRWLAAMEDRGTTVDRRVLTEVRAECAAESHAAEKVCLEIAAARGCELTLPKAGRNESLDRFVFGWGKARCGTCGREQEVRPSEVEKINEKRPACNFCREAGTAGTVTAEGHPGLALERLHNPKAKTDRPALDAKIAVPHWLETLPPGSDELRFVEAFERRGRREKALGYCESYEDFGLPLFGHAGWLVLHATFNAAGTQLLRRSCSSPNLQQVGKKKETNLRQAFGPAPGREWWSLDYKNIELRLPAYESGERELIELFERPNDPPYYGSEHLINFHTVYPDLWDQAVRAAGIDGAGPWLKKEWEDTWYQWCKNGDFAVGYQAGDATADRAFHRAGSRQRLLRRFANKAELNRRMVDFARRHGYVETMPDREVCPDHGYRLMVMRSERSEVSPTEPLNYHVTGTAGWIQLKAMNRVGPVLEEWTREDPRGYFQIMEVHDELVFDFPKGTGPEPWRTNLPKIRVIQRLMERGGDDVGVPTPVDVEWCPVNWASGVTIKAGAEDAPVKLSGPGAFAASRRRREGVTV